MMVEFTAAIRLSSSCSGKAVVLPYCSGDGEVMFMGLEMCGWNAVEQLKGKKKKKNPRRPEELSGRLSSYHKQC